MDTFGSRSLQCEKKQQKKDKIHAAHVVSSNCLEDAQSNFTLNSNVITMV